MDDIEHAIHTAWTRLAPRLRADPAELARRLARNRSATRNPSRAWCLAVRASDTRMARCVHDDPFDSRTSEPKEHLITLDAADLRRLCAPVSLDPPGHTLAEAAAMLGVATHGLLAARVAGVFHTKHVAGLGGRWGKPRPLIWSRRPLDPASRGFVVPDPVWSWTASFLTSRIPADLSPQILRRVPHFQPRTPGSPRRHD
jgi:hypothetical protein